MKIVSLCVMLAGVGLCVGLVPAAKAQSTDCPVSKTDEASVVDTVRTMYAAATLDDMTKLHAIFAPGAYLFDGGVRYNSVDALMQLIHDYRAKGAKFVWNVTQPDVHLHCNEAWVTFVNDGSITMPGATAATPQKWLESANMEKRDGVWKIVFFESMRVPAAEAAH
jgi:hypothetical protein